MPLLKSASYNLASKECLSIFIAPVRLRPHDKGGAPARDKSKVSKREEPLILCIETATRAGSIAISRGATLLSTRTGDAVRSHSVDLLELIREALEEASLGVQEVELFAVALGPGSFTGLRIGVATAKSLASTLERKVVGVPTLYAVARSCGAAGQHVVALLPAGRGELFAQSFRVSDSGEVIPLDNPKHVAPTTLLENYRQLRDVRWCGEGAQAHSEKIRSMAEEEGIPFIVEGSEKERGFDVGWLLCAPAENLASYVCLLALEKYRRGEASGPEDLHAIYVRPSDAELKEKCRT